MQRIKALCAAGAIGVAAAAVVTPILVQQLASVWPNAQTAPRPIGRVEAASSRASPASSPDRSAPPASAEASAPAVASRALEAASAKVERNPAFAAASLARASDRPGFDVVRVEPTGDVVVAGHAAPNAAMELRDGGRVIGQAAANESGQFVMLPPRLAPGSHRLELAMRRQGMLDLISDAVTIEVPAAKPGRARDAREPITPAPLARLTSAHIPSIEGPEQDGRRPSRD